jgi:signal transduction histidine kinase
MTKPSVSPIARLLVVDDEAAQMRALCDTLEDAGYATSGFTSPNAALTCLREQQFDLVLSDLVMPELDGIAFLRAAQEIDPHLLGIVMTGHGAIETAIAAMHAGALDYVLKPFKLSVILPVLSRAIEVRRMRLEIEQLQERVREHVTELERANRELEGFSYSVSHDLRAPLRAISGYSSILLDTYATQLPAPANQLLKKVTESAHRMGELIERLLQFSQLSRQPLRKQRVAMKPLVAEVVDELCKMPDGSAATAQVNIGPLPDSVGDPVLLRQVFVNLVANALKFSRQRHPPLIEIGGREADGNAFYFVRDNGAGFDMQYVSHLFGVFQRLHSAEQFEGTGIGLSLTQRIVERHGGRIWAEAAVDQGATFHFSLPAAGGS